MVRRSKRLRDQVKKAENESSKEEEKNVEPPRKKRKVDPEAKAKKEKKAKTDFQKRKKRALKQKLYLISRTESEEEATYVVLGSTGSVYYVTLKCNERSKCSCIDARIRSHNCKHILFVLVRVLNVGDDHVVFKRGRKKNIVKKSELKEFIDNAPKVISKGAEASKLVKTMYEVHTGNSLEQKKEVQQRKMEGVDNCPICFDELVDDLIFCQYSCGRSIHKDCFDRWSEIRKQSGEVPSCVYCRANWNPKKDFKKRHTNLARYVD